MYLHEFIFNNVLTRIYFLQDISKMDKTMRKRLSVLASAVLLANVFLPTGVVFAEESTPVVPVAQVESQGTENAPVLAAVNQDSEGSQEINSVETDEQENATESLVATTEVP